MTDTRCLALAVLLLSTLGVWAGEPPYPQSTVITGITWDSDPTQSADGSDAWPITWADDGHQYTSYGDGWGFRNPSPSSKRSMAWARIEGPGGSPEGFNVPSPDETDGDGASGKKPSGMLSTGGTLYMMVRNADGSGRQCEVWRSQDHGENWTDAGWNFAELGFCAFLNFGRDYAGARNGYVYMYSPNTSSAYNETDEVVLARVPKNQIMTRSAWEFFSGMNGGVPQWSSNIADRSSIFDFTRGCNRLDVTYNPGLGRYLMTMRARAKTSSSNPNHFSIYDAPEPWGPWTTVYYTESSLPGMSEMTSGGGGWGESQHIPSKWISSDGKEFYLLYAGDDSFRTRKATLTTSGGGPVCGNGTRETGEECDGGDLGGETCESLGLGSGSLGCGSDCRFDTSACGGTSPDPPATPENLHRTDRGL